MSEALDRTRAQIWLAQFPLPMVALPHEIVPLHIFEPRYRAMVSEHDVGGDLIGLIRFESEGQFSERPEPGAVGCAVEIRAVQMLDDGRSNIVVNGIIRYRLVEYVDANKPYLTAKAEYFEDDVVDGDDLAALAAEATAMFRRVAEAAYRLSDDRRKLPELPEADPEKLSFLIAAAFNLSNDEKYELLKMTSTAARLDRLRPVLSQAVEQMEETVKIHAAAKTNGHRKIKIGLN